MKFIHLFTILVLLLQVYADTVVVPTLLTYRISLLNLLKEKNVDLDIDVGGRRKVDVYYNKTDTENLKPVLIFVHGGGWITSNKYEYSKVGSLAVREDYVSVLVGYPLYPLGTFDDMVENVHKAITWTYKNISKYGGDRNNIILSGHSAGSHLSALTVFKSSLGIKNNNKYLAPLPKIKKMVLLNGPFDFSDYDVSRLFLPCVEVDKGITEGLVHLLTRNKDVSPTDVLKAYPAGSIKDFGVSEFVIFNAESDQLVPQSSARNFIKQLRRVSPNTTVTSVSKEGFDHFTLIFGAMTDKPEKEDLFLELIKIVN